MGENLRKYLVLLLVVAQIALGRSAGGVMCLGECDEESNPAPCSHQDGHCDWPVPVPAEPHNDDCGCIDVFVQVSRPDSPRPADELLRIAGLACHAAPVMPDVLCVRPVQSVFSANRPPGPSPGLRTTRLLI